MYRDGGTCWVTDHATQSFTLFIPDFTRRYYNLRLQTVPTLTVWTIVLSRATPIPVLYRTLGALDCRLISSTRRLAAA
jgi:hypothetical protein